MMVPLAGVGDPSLLVTVRPILGALGILILPLSGSALGPCSLLCSVRRHPPFLPVVHPGVWLQAGASISSDLSGGMLGKGTEGASILGMFIISAPGTALGFNFIYPSCFTIPLEQAPTLDKHSFRSRGNAPGIKHALRPNGLDPESR